MFSYIYYRMYIAYSKKNDSPMFRTFMYMTLLLFVLVIVFIIFTEKLLLVNGILSESRLNGIKRSYIFWIVIFLTIFGITFLRFSRKDISEYEKQFADCYLLNKKVKTWMLIVLPFFLFYLFINIYILLFGGHVLGKEIVGLFAKK